MNPPNSLVFYFCSMTEPTLLRERTRIYDLVHRFLHWGIAITMSMTLLTILLRLGWMNKFHVADILDAELTMRGIELDESERIRIAKQIRKPMWDWHIYSGYALAVLFGLRLLYNRITGNGFHSPFRKQTVLHEKIASWSYLLFYVFIFGSLVTGLLIEHGPREWRKGLESVHEWSLYYLIAFILLHFVGLYISERTTDAQKVRKMWAGRP